MQRFQWAALWAIVFALAACESDDTGDSAVDAGLPPDAAQSADVEPARPEAALPPDAELPADAELNVDAARDAAPPDPPVVEAHTPEPVRVTGWTVGVVRDPAAGDPVAAAIEAGTFVQPETGVDAAGIRWQRATPGNNGALGNFGRTLHYAVTTLHVDESTHLLARVDSAVGIYVNGALQPADVYGTGRMRVPLVTRPGENLIVARIYAPRRLPEIELFTTPDEIGFNPADLTLPDLVVGDDSALFVGVPVLNFSAEPIVDLAARVEESAHFEPTVVVHPALPGGAVTQVPFRLQLRAPPEAAGEAITVRLRVDAPGLGNAYTHQIELATVAADSPFRRTFRSTVDRSVQYYGVRPPSAPAPEPGHGLMLSLHGAGVEAIGQARAYAAKDWLYVVAATNRRPFGFDWEEWGRLDAIEVLDHAMASYAIDPTRVYLGGHSMGGHGTWHVGIMHPGRFATIAPSAGWISLQGYGGRSAPAGPFARSGAASNTLAYTSNLARRGVYIIHGSADDNVPVSEGRAMADHLADITDDLVYHEEPGAGHWWDGDASPGADCVDWPPLFEFMRAHRLDPYELRFDFKTPSPWVSARHAFVTIRSAADPYEDCAVHAEPEGDRLVVSTDNVRGMVIDGEALGTRGIAEVVVDGEVHAVSGGPLEIGPQHGKRPGQHGPFNEAFQRPFCYVYAADGPVEYMRYAAYLTSYWAIYGNGLACAVTYEALTDTIRRDHNLVYLGVAPEGSGLPFAWDDGTIRVGGQTYADSAIAFVYPEGEGLAAYIVATPGSEALLFSVMPFSSGAGLPDYLVWSAEGGRAAGFFDAEWGYSSELGVP